MLLDMRWGVVVCLLGSGCFGRILAAPAPDAGAPVQDASPPALVDAAPVPAPDAAVLPQDAGVDAAGSKPTLLSTGQNNAFFVALDDADVFWTTNSPTTVAKVSKKGGSTTLLWSYPSSMLTQIAVDASYAYWIQAGTTQKDGRVWRVPVGGGTAEAIVSNQFFPYGIAIDATSVYWTNNGLSSVPGSGSVMRANLDGSNATVVAPNQTYPRWVAVEGNRLCWTRGPNLSKGEVVCAGVDGSNPQVLASSTNGLDLSQLRLDATNAYWIELNTAIERADLGGGGSSIFSSQIPGMWGLAIDGTHLYGSDVALYRFPLGGGTPVVLVDYVNDAVMGMALDATNVYFSTTQGKICVLPK